MAAVVSVARHAGHEFSKTVVKDIRIIAGHGIEGDAHAGVTVKHRSRVAVDPDQPNLRQVHLLQHELFADLAKSGFDLSPGDLGENILTEGISLLELPTDTVLRIGPDVLLRVTGLRNPCAQIDSFRPGLLQRLVHNGADGKLVRKAGVMAVALAGGMVRCGDRIEATRPALPHRPLERV